MNHYQAVLFDFDYTLADASEGIAACISYALAKMGLPSASKQDMLHTVGLSLKETFVSLTGIKDEGQAVRFTEFFVQKSDEVMVTGTRLYQDALPCLYALKQEGYRLAVVTTKYHRRIDAVFAREQAAGIFDAILGGDDVKEPKPSPEGIFLALDALQCPPSRALYVGDSLVDAKTAQAAQIHFAAVLTGTTSAAQFEEFPRIGVYQGLSSLCTGTGLLQKQEVNRHV